MEGTVILDKMVTKIRGITTGIERITDTTDRITVITETDRITVTTETDRITVITGTAVTGMITEIAETETIIGIVDLISKDIHMIRVVSRGTIKMRHMSMGESKTKVTNVIREVSKGVISNSKGVINNHKGVTNNHKGVTSNSRGVTNNSRGVTNNHKGVTNNSRGAVNKGVPNNSKGVISRNKEVTNNSKEVSNRIMAAINNKGDIRNSTVAMVDRDLALVRGITLVSSHGHRTVVQLPQELVMPQFRHLVLTSPHPLRSQRTPEESISRCHLLKAVIDRVNVFKLII